MLPLPAKDTGHRPAVCSTTTEGKAQRKREKLRKILNAEIALVNNDLNYVQVIFITQI